MKKLFSRIILTSLSFVFAVGFQEAQAFGRKKAAAPEEIRLPKKKKVSGMAANTWCTAKLGALNTIKSLGQFSNRESCLEDHGAKNPNFVAAAKKSHKTFWCANDGLRTQLTNPDDLQRLREHCNLMHDTYMADEYASMEAATPAPAKATPKKRRKPTKSRGENAKGSPRKPGAKAAGGARKPRPQPTRNQ